VTKALPLDCPAKVDVFKFLNPGETKDPKEVIYSSIERRAGAHEY
jgi:hypothetical protein